MEWSDHYHICSTCYPEQTTQCIPVLKCRFFHDGGHFPRFGSATTYTYLPKKIRKLHLSKGSLVWRHTNLSPTRRANQDLEISVQTSGTPHRQKTRFKPRRLSYVYDTALTPKTAGLKDWIADNHVAKQAFHLLEVTITARTYICTVRT